MKNHDWPALDPNDYDDADIDDADNPELTSEDFDRARPAREVFPELDKAPPPFRQPATSPARRRRG